jgi:alpha-beta hydrolase superfamily lysophospholipase
MRRRRRGIVCAAAVFFWAMGAHAMAAGFTEHSVSLGALHGTLAVPAGQGRFDAVLIWSGSGPTDRDGNSPGGLANNSLKMVAHGLAEAGFATLRTDKRGIGESAGAMGREEDLRFGHFVDDAAGWAAWLAARTDIRRVFLLGHSEGALVVTLAADKVKPIGLILVSAPGEPAAAILRRQMAALEETMPADLRAESETIMAALERGEAVANVSEALLGAYRPSVQPYLMSWFAHDPAAVLAATDAPALVVQGDRDFQVSMRDAELLAAARSGVRLAAIAGMNHVLKDAPAEREENYATYFRPMLPLSGALLPTLIDFLRAATAANDR